MGIRDRIEDAKALWELGRKEGAFTSILIAAAATARKRYPIPKKGDSITKGRRPAVGEPAPDNVAFKTFVLDEMEKITGGPKYNVAFPFQDNDKTPLEDILYHQLRCTMVHEGETPSSVEFTEPEIQDGKVFAVLNLTDPLGFPEVWLWNLARVVASAPENTGLFDDYSINQKPPCDDNAKTTDTTGAI